MEWKSANKVETKTGNIKFASVTIKIIIIFTLFILVSNLSTNYINLIYNRSILIKLMKQQLVKDLKSISEFCNIQYEIYQYTKDLKGSIGNIEKKGRFEIENGKAIVLGIKPAGAIAFQSSSSKIKRYNLFNETETLKILNDNLSKEMEEGFISFFFNREEFFGTYKYNSKWDLFIVRAEELNEFYFESRRVFRDISILIIIITSICAIIGIFVLKYILRFIGVISQNIMEMIQEQKLRLIDLKNASNDNITFLGVAFNSLSNTIDTLLNIFRKFTTKDIVIKAYKEKEIRLEGSKVELVILFSDIKSFTFITETLGTDIIKLLNLHYTHTIREIILHDGIIGSIIGDAILAVYGVLGDSTKNKSHQAVLSAYRLQETSEALRVKMFKRKEEIVRARGSLTPEEEKVFTAVLLEIGVGIDGGEVFYGTIGSYERMTNTVIGDNVNSASRLEGLTRVYKIPVICSEFIRDDVETNCIDHNIRFIEIDTVQVKGKTIGKKIFWPILERNFDETMRRDIECFQEGLRLYYRGDWKAAYEYFARCGLPLADVFKERTKDAVSPENWSGIWTMTSK